MLKPTVTWKDSGINSGTVPDYEAQNLDSVAWQHVTDNVAITDDVARASGMMLDGSTAAPELTYVYTPAAQKLYQDTLVTVTAVKLGNLNLLDTEGVVTMDRKTPCDEKGDSCQWGQEGFTGGNFIVHINSFDLVIHKVIDGSPNSQGDSFLFRIFSANGVIGNVTSAIIHGSGSVTIKGLPSDTYRVVEDSNWCWSYTADEIEHLVTPDMIENGEVHVTFTNTPNRDIPLSSETHLDNQWSVNVK